MRRVLPRFGIGAAEVATHLEGSTLRAGETVDMRVEARGGVAAQRVEGVDVRLLARFPTGSGHETAEVAAERVAGSFTVGPDESVTHTATVGVPHRMPVTRGGTTVRVETTLDIEWALDPTTSDEVAVAPGERFAAVVEGVEGLGFTNVGVGPAALDEVTGLDMATDGADLAAERPYLKQFDYVPRSGPFAGRIETVEIVPVPSPPALHLLVAVDHHTDVVGEQVRTDHPGEWHRVREPSVARVRKELRSLLESYV